MTTFLNCSLRCSSQNSHSHITPCSEHRWALPWRSCIGRDWLPTLYVHSDMVSTLLTYLGEVA